MLELRGEVTGLRVDMQGLREEMAELRADQLGLREDLVRIEKKFDQNFEFLSGKIDHFIDFTTLKITRTRNQLEEDRYVRKSEQAKNETRFQAIEQRVEKLEAAIAAKEGN